MNNTLSRSFLSFLLLLSVFTLSLPQIGYAQTGTQTAAVDYSKHLQQIEQKVDARRKELGIPGMSLVIVKDDKIIYIKGLGYKDFENKIVVTPDTQFAIGSATKAFTALSVLMTADEGKLSLDDSPKKLLPYFKMYDPETDKNITIRDLMSHSSGLNRTDLAMITGKLNRAELIQVAAQAKPTAKLREKFQYQNIMFAAAGELVTQAQKTPWETFVPDRIFKPLGMTNSNMSMKQMEKAKDYSFGYSYNFDTKETTKLPFRDIDEVAPAGSINSSARDMGEWIRFVMNGGTVNGKRLVSEANFAEWIKPQMKMSPAMDYGLGWFLQKWNGHTVVQHGGNIDGFNSLVAMIPEKKIGFVMLTNVSGSSLGNDIMPTIFSTILDGPKDEAVKLPLKTMQLLAGKYGTAERSIEVKIEGEDLFLVVPGQPPYKLERTAPRTFKALGLPDGFGAKFTPETGDATELEMIQPQGNRKLPRITGDAPKTTAPESKAAKELIGRYTPPGSTEAVIEVKEDAGKVTFNIPGQQPYALIELEKDKYSLSPLPETYSLKAKRDAAGKLTSVVVTQPEGEFEFKLAGTLAASLPPIAVDELMQKAIDAAGGEANWRKITTRYTEADVDLENQGVQGRSVSWSKAPNKSATDMTLIALGKTIATGWEFFDGTNAEEMYSFAPVEKYTGKRLEDIAVSSDLYGQLNWKTFYKKVTVKPNAKVGEEDCYVVDIEPNKGSPFTEYYSTKTFYLLKRTGIITSSTSAQTIPYTITFDDYRAVDGLMLPYKMISYNPGNGNIVSTVKLYKHNVKIDDKTFAPKKLK